MTTVPARVLVVDDAESTLEIVRRQLEHHGHEVRTARDVAAALRQLEAAPADVLITDLRMPGASGLELAQRVRLRHPEMAMVMITGYPSLENAVEAGRTGIVSYLPKPFTQDELLGAVERALAERGQGRGGADDEALPGLVGRAVAMALVVRAIRKAAASIEPCLVYGEPGSGLRTAARAVHDLSTRSDAPLVWADLEHVAEPRIEDELLSDAPAGLVARSDAATLVIRCPERMPETTQIRLLTVLRERRLRDVRSRRGHRVDLRLIAVSSGDLSAEVRDGRMRSDLARVLSGLAIRMPPLRDRLDDLPGLVHHLLRRRRGPLGDEKVAVEPEALSVLQRHSWPGNVAELKAVLDEAVLRSGQLPLSLSALPAWLRRLAEDDSGNRSLAEVERRHIQDVLDRVGGNKTRAAAILGIDRRTLRAKLTV